MPNKSSKPLTPEQRIKELERQLKEEKPQSALFETHDQHHASRTRGTVPAPHICTLHTLSVGAAFKRRAAPRAISVKPPAIRNAVRSTAHWALLS